MNVAAAILGLAACFAIPGITWGPLLVPATTTMLGRLGRTFGSSLLVTALLCTLLAYAGLLRPSVLLPALAAVAATPLVFSGVRRELTHQGRSLARRPARLFATLGFFLLAVCICVAPLQYKRGGNLLPRSSTPWYYLNLAREVAVSGSIPTHIPEWGAQRAFQTDYLPGTAHAAGVFTLLPGSLIARAEAYRWATLLCGLLLMSALLRHWFPSGVSVAGSCLLFTTLHITSKFKDFRAETFGLVLFLFVFWVALEAVHRPSWRLLATATLTAGLLYLSHAATFLLLGPALAGLVAGETFHRGRKPLHILVRPATVATVVFAGGFLVGSLATGAIAGQMRIIGYVIGNTPQSARSLPPPPAPDQVPEGWKSSGDSTWDFFVAGAWIQGAGRRPPDRFFGPHFASWNLLSIWPKLDGKIPSGLRLLFILVLAPLLFWPLLHPRRRRALLIWWTFGVVLLAGAYLLFFASVSYVPRRTGTHRLLPYVLFIPVISATFVLLGLGKATGALLGRRLHPTAVRLLAGALLVAGVTLPAAPITGDEEGGVSNSSLSADGYSTYLWIKENVFPGALVLTNAYTDGSLYAISRHPGLVDGRAPYLEDPAFLGEATRLLLGARRFFADAQEPAAERFLDEQRVDYLLVATRNPADLGGYQLFRPNLERLLSSKRLSLVRSFSNERLYLFKTRRG